MAVATLLLHALAYAPHLGLTRAPSRQARRAPTVKLDGVAVDGSVEVQNLLPSPILQPREVISSVMAALHRSNWDAPTPYYGFEVALRFLAPTHQAKLNNAKPAGFYRYLRQPHKVYEIEWNEWRFEGDLITLQMSDSNGIPREEAYQQTSLRSSPDADWVSARWKLVKVDCDYGETTQQQWMLEAVFATEPDELEIASDSTDASSDAGSDEEQALNWNGLWVPVESPQQVVSKVMNALRKMDEPYPLHGAAVATRYCSPQNRASELSPQVFARYLEDPWCAPSLVLCTLVRCLPCAAPLAPALGTMHKLHMTCACRLPGTKYWSSGTRWISMRRKTPKSRCGIRQR